jgi:hypothetical protein
MNQPCDPISTFASSASEGAQSVKKSQQMMTDERFKLTLFP